jgi:hypothetical protein
MEMTVTPKEKPMVLKGLNSPATSSRKRGGPAEKACAAMTGKDIISPKQMKAPGTITSAGHHTIVPQGVHSRFQHRTIGASDRAPADGDTRNGPAASP